MRRLFFFMEFLEESYMTLPDSFLVPSKEYHVCKLKKSLWT